MNEPYIDDLWLLCAAAYQVVGAADGPLEMLDNLSAAANGDPLPHHPMEGIPWVPPYYIPLPLDRNNFPNEDQCGPDGCCWKGRIEDGRWNWEWVHRSVCYRHTHWLPHDAPCLPTFP
jgi:hypothetical protein